jgi:pilus assembly protein Flp/PilA
MSSDSEGSSRRRVTAWTTGLRPSLILLNPRFGPLVKGDVFEEKPPVRSYQTKVRRASVARFASRSRRTIPPHEYGKRIGRQQPVRLRYSNLRIRCHDSCPALRIRSAKDIPVLNVLEEARSFLVAEHGPTAVEFAVMLALIVLACVTVVQNLGSSVSGTFSSTSSSAGS